MPVFSRIKQQMGCKHSFVDFNSIIDKSMNKGFVQCSSCGLVIRKEKENNMRKITCPECGAFFCFAEEIAGLHYECDLACKHCGATVVRTTDCVLGLPIFS